MKQFLQKLKQGLKEAWKRLTSSKVAWMALPAAVAQIVLAVTGTDISATINTIFAALWSLLTVFLAVNNPTDKQNF